MFREGTLRVAGALLLLVLAAGCVSKAPIWVGFVAELTGKRGQLGVDARDGAQLAVDMINEQGGIAGRSVQLLVRDDKGDPEIARQMDAALVEQGVVAIIGHTTSGQAAAVFEQINAAEVVLLSPGASSEQFSGQADYFFRALPTTDLMGGALAWHIYYNCNARDLVCVYDENNRSYGEFFWQAVQAKFEALGGKAGHLFTFTPDETALDALMMQVQAVEPEGVVFIASPVDTALMVQYGHQQGLNARLFSSPWAQSDALLEKGGQAVEGLEMIAGYTPQTPYPPSQRFAEQFEARYGRQPTLLASNGYEAVLVLAYALKQTRGQRQGLPEALVRVKDLEGAYSPISLDEYGDARRDVYIARVKDRAFEIVDVISPEN